MPEAVSPLLRVRDTDMHHGTCVTYVPWCMPVWLISVSFDVGGGENVPGIPGTCATRNLTYLVRGSCIYRARIIKLRPYLPFPWYPTLLVVQVSKHGLLNTSWCISLVDNPKDVSYFLMEYSSFGCAFFTASAKLPRIPIHMIIHSIITWV